MACVRQHMDLQVLLPDAPQPRSPPAAERPAECAGPALQKFCFSAARRSNDSMREIGHAILESHAQECVADSPAFTGSVRPVLRALLGAAALFGLWLSHQPAQAAMLTTKIVINPVAYARAARVGARTVVIVRDAEIESLVHALAAPLFQAAGLDAESVPIHLVKEPSLNAFVAGGRNMFINTGLLLRSEHAGQLIGVIGHETGHIAGAHLARKRQALRGVADQSSLALLLGAVTAVATQNPDVGMAVAVGGAHMARQSFLKYTRAEESAADQFALAALDGSGQSARGLLELLETLGDQDVLATRRQDAYARTHPLTHDRIAFVRDHVARSAHSDTPPPSEYAAMFGRMKGKLHGFLDPPARTFARYPETDVTVEARYARAIAHSRRSNLPQALREIDSLIAEHPADPYFHELKGQILFENGRTRKAVDSCRRAVELLPDAPLLRVGLAHALIELGDPAVLADAAEHLESAVRGDRHIARAWYLLSVALGRGGRLGLSALASAEHAHLLGRRDDAKRHAERALKRLPQGSPAALRAEDIQLGP